MKIIFNKILLFISSFIPLYFLVIVKETTELINTNLSFNLTNSIMLIFNFLLIIFGIIGVIKNYKKNAIKNIKIIKYQNITCQNFLPYFSLFVLFAIAFELEFVSMAIIYFFVLAMIGVVYVKNNFFYVNPFLNIIGFGVYEITYEFQNKTFTEKFFSFHHPQLNAKINNCFIKNKKTH